MPASVEMSQSSRGVSEGTFTQLTVITHDRPIARCQRLDVFTPWMLQTTEQSYFIVVVLAAAVVVVAVVVHRHILSEHINDSHQSSLHASFQLVICSHFIIHRLFSSSLEQSNASS